MSSGHTEQLQLPAGVTLFDFPRGAKAGICLHEIFEQLDYSGLTDDSITTVVRSSLANNGFHEQWLPVIGNMVREVTSARIISGNSGFSLSGMKKGDWQTEMEFYLPVRLIAPDIIQLLFEEVLDATIFGDYYEVLRQLSFRKSHGMLQGFIDLVFICDGLYYILDWKSNHLGMNRADYAQGMLHESMCHNAYILQYHLYTLALDRLLKWRLPGYNYETHFGGVLYLYLRGISAGSGGCGIYSGRPPEKFIRRADEMLLI